MQNSTKFHCRATKQTSCSTHTSYFDRKHNSSLLDSHIFVVNNKTNCFIHDSGGARGAPPKTRVYIHTYIHIYIHTDKHTNIQTYMHTHISTYIHTQIYIIRMWQTAINYIQHNIIHCISVTVARNIWAIQAVVTARFPLCIAKRSCSNPGGCRAVLPAHLRHSQLPHSARRARPCAQAQLQLPSPA